MKSDVMIKTLLGIIAVLLFIIVVQGLTGTAPAIAENSEKSIGRYQISAWAARAGSLTHHAGYYIVDTVTGKVVDSKAEVHSHQPIEVEDVIHKPE